MKNNLPPIFVLGCPRSGTTLLARFLERTSYGSPVETHFITKYFKKLKKYGDLLQDGNAARLLRDILRERPVMQWKLNIDIHEFLEDRENLHYENLVNNLCMMRFGPLGKKSWGDKTPHYILDLDILDELFPESRYLYIVRDGRDVALSLLKKAWGPNNFYACARYWALCNRESSTLQSLRKSGRLVEIRYEKLLLEPEAHIRQIYGFLNEPVPEPQIKEMAASVKRENFNKWEKMMAAGEIKIFEAAAGRDLKRLGYKTTYDQVVLKPYEEWVWRIHETLFRTLHLLKLNTVDTIKIKLSKMEPFAD